MEFKLRPLNCIWLLIPLLVWNIILGPKLSDPRLISDANSPTWQLIAENGIRILVFALPLLIPMQLRDRVSNAGLVLFGIGTLVYFSSWLPLMLAPQSPWSQSAIGALAPFISPLAIFWGIALIGHSLGYGLISVAFVILHVTHGIQNF